MNVHPSAPAMLPLQENQCLDKEQHEFSSPKRPRYHYNTDDGYQVNPTSKAKYHTIQSIQYQIAPSINLALLQDFTAGHARLHFYNSIMLLEKKKP